MSTLTLLVSLLPALDPGALSGALGALLDQATRAMPDSGAPALLHHLPGLVSRMTGLVRRLCRSGPRRALPGMEQSATPLRRHRDAQRLVGARADVGSGGGATTTDDLVQTNAAQRHRHQQDATLSLQDALSDGTTLALPVLSWTTTRGGVLCGKVLGATPRGDFAAWAGHLDVEPEGLSRDGETRLRVISETGLPGRGRRVRVVVLATFHETAGQTRTAA